MMGSKDAVSVTSDIVIQASGFSADAVAELTPFQREWKARWERAFASAAPHRFTFEGQRVPWIDPVPAPDDTRPYTGPRGLSPREMLRMVCLANEECGSEAALRLLHRSEQLIRSLGREDWNAEVDKILALLAR